MPEGAQAGAARRVFRVEIKAPIQDVWREITRTDAPIAAFFNSRMHLGPGGLSPGTRLAMRTPNGAWTGVVGEILECTPPTRLSHTFRFTAYDDPPCVVTYELRAIPGGTEFTLVLSDVAPGTKTAKQMVQGASLIVNTLKRVVETGRPAPVTRLLFVMFGLMAPLTPKRCKSEHWPVE